MENDEPGSFLEDHAGALNDAADAMNRSSGVAETLHAIVVQARATMPGIDHVGISVVSRRGEIRTDAATDDLVRRLDDIQYAHGQGPCISALAQVDTVLVQHARHEQRWPQFISRAVALGLRAQLGIRLYRVPAGVGALNMYSTSQDVLDPHLPYLAELFARHAALALGHAQHTEQLETALQTRSLIGQAIGIVMERYGLDEHRAFEYLTRTSTTSNTKLRDVAVELVRHQPGPPATSFTGADATAEVGAAGTDDPPHS